MAWLGGIRTGSTSTALVSSGLSESVKVPAERAIASVVEAECPLCKVELRVHDDRACCQCCGDSYRPDPHAWKFGSAPSTGRGCWHREAVWAER